MILGLARHYGFAVAVGHCAIGYGALWGFVARSGRCRRWPPARGEVGDPVSRRRPRRGHFSVLMSITKRYFTSLFSMRS
jgi:hypothetical protein